MPGGYKVLDASSNLSLTSMGARQKPMLLGLASSLLMRLGIASNIAKLPMFLAAIPERSR